MNKTPCHRLAPYIYDARYRAHPYMLSITVLSDTNAYFRVNKIWTLIFFFSPCGVVIRTEGVFLV